MVNKQTTLELQHVKDADATAVVRAINIGLREKSTQDPLLGEVTEAYFRVKLGAKRMLELALPDRITWNDATAVLTFDILNGDLASLREGTDYEYHIVVKHDGDFLFVKQGPLIIEVVV